MSETSAEQLKGKVAFVTGGARGIGLGIATVLAERGATVAICDLAQSACDAAVSDLGTEGYTVLGTAADVTDRDSLEGAVSNVITALGQIDILVANAGVWASEGYQDRPEYNDADWDLTHSVNVRGVVHSAEAVIPHMKERGSGKIVNIASHGGRKPRGTATGRTLGLPYSVSKAGVIQWTHGLAIELAPFNINVNAVCPGELWTNMIEGIYANRQNLTDGGSGGSVREEYDESMQNTVPLGRGQTPRDIGNAVAFLSSDDASEITGQALNVNGGARMN
ncbi:MAG: SDR family oxidoreductase [Chloroflexi bacterium]|jgi:NAD(P)-dependent dehydrogenase (short-subunit alcohol dehydrogenase family)|nr:SDR family oxidoreductase [Chloroflexota bacterium]MBT4514928.1 SDR family oxidoreductase [Chloroflexota bacterium]MBT6682379.1 SDR family oxidoreductase [Chloroflexota bacterium]